MELPEEYIKAWRNRVKRLETIYSRFKNYARVAEYLNVPMSSVYRALQEPDWVPTSGKLVEVLNMPKLTTQAAVMNCSECGKALTYKHICAKKEKKPHNSKPKRIRIDLDPDITQKEAAMIRHLSRKTRTRVLLMAAYQLQEGKDV